jgi:Protein of unknown function (DUF1573)
MYNRSFGSIIIIGLLSVQACKNSGEGVKEIRTAEGGANASVVRNPVSADSAVDTTQMAAITFAEPEFNFGNVKEGEVVSHKFKFTNTGKAPLTILECRASCGCTVPEWPKTPIPPGGTGEISAKFNTDGKHEKQAKTIFVTANTHPNETHLTLKGFVKPKSTK